MENIIYPLVGTENTSVKDADHFENLLANKCNGIREHGFVLVNPEYCMLKTKYGTSFGVIFTEEVRYSKKNFIHKYGYRKNRISYRKDDLTPVALKFILKSKIKDFEPKQYKKVIAYTMVKNDENGNETEPKLVEIGTISYLVTNNKKESSAYIDGAYVSKDFRRKGVATAMQDLLHLLISTENVDYITADVKKDVDENYNVNYKSAMYKIMESFGYKPENYNYRDDSSYFVTPIIINKTNVNIDGHNPIISFNDFYKTKDENEKENMINENGL